MSYRRVLPRDAFNESDLLRLIGKLWIAVNERHPGNVARFVEEDMDAFDIRQDLSSGAIHVANVTFEIGGVRHLLERPLNSRDRWPLWVRNPEDPDQEEVRVFDEEGNLTADMLELIGAPAP